MTYNIVEDVISMTFQLGSALLDAYVLAILHKGDTYGYVVTQEVKGMINVSESTLYPVLRRLMKLGYLATYDQEHMGRNRRYYALTESGKKQYEFYVEEWKLFSQKVDDVLLKGGLEDE